ncbi:40S ribosomal protein S24 isoform X1 [Hypanus sabinus]|uniref:40S ribosomal protein S24 isoform X1 n=1 Tax=Hypanus sabinus TaxID=79690 RepID=UPI0028C4E879|nr:40S ribosomal protein S24 isoform X1 [Hypanus sabinus]XP_059802692.1 40S ribosomal protein S24 isoform X1 [Hypanus sabinus]
MGVFDYTGCFTEATRNIDRVHGGEVDPCAGLCLQLYRAHDNKHSLGELMAPNGDSFAYIFGNSSISIFNISIFPFQGSFEEPDLELHVDYGSLWEQDPLSGFQVHLQKFSDDSAIVGCISKGDEAEYRATMRNFVTWCEQDHLQLNVKKTKELVVDLRRAKAPVAPVSIQGVSVDMVEDYKYLEIRIDNKLDWSKNTEAVYKKGQSRLYFLRRLRSFNICWTMLRMFYESEVASAIMFAVVCWGSRPRVADTNRINKLIRKASDVVGVELDSLTVVSEKRMLSKLHAILDNVSHPLHNVLVRHRSTFSQRLIPPRCNTEHRKKSFLPVAIKLYNSSLGVSDTLSQ